MKSQERDHGSWPSIDVKLSNEIRSIVETDLKAFEKYLKRPRRSIDKASRKKKRNKGETKGQEKTKHDSEMKVDNDSSRYQIVDAQSFLMAHLLKKHFRFGINTLTRLLERSVDFHFILVFSNSLSHAKKEASSSDELRQSSLNQFNLLTKHLRVMSSNLNQSAGCLDPNVSSSFLCKLLNLNRIGSFGLLKRVNLDETKLELELSKIDVKLSKINPKNPKLVDFYKLNRREVDDKVKLLLDKIGANVSKLLPKLEEKSKFEAFFKPDINSIINKKTDDQELKDISMDQVTLTQNRFDKSNESAKVTFGADFISINETKQTFSSAKSKSIDFNSRKFILINEVEQDANEMDYQDFEELK